MVNAFEQVSLLASESLMHLEDSLVLTNLATKDKTSEWNTTPNGYSIGDTINIRTNPEFQTNEFSTTISTQDIRSSKRSMQIEKHFDVSVAVTAKEQKLDLESFSEQVIKPAAYSLAEKVETYLASKFIAGGAQGLYTSDTLFASRADMAAARKEGTLQQLSPTGRFCLANLDLEAVLLGADYFTTYNNRGEDGSKVFRDASMGHAMGMDFFAARHFPDATTHTAGAPDGIVTNHPAGDVSLVGTTNLPYDGGSAGVDIKAGDRIKVAGMKRPLLVASAATADSGNIALEHPITEAVPDGAAITVIGTTQAMTFKGAIMDDQSMAIAMPMLDPAVDKPSSVVSNNGISLRVVTGYDMSTKKTTLSIDCLCGAAVWDPRRITLLSEY